MSDPAVVAKLLLARCESLSVGSPAMPVAMPDVSFTPPVDGKGKPKPYLRVSLFPNAPFWAALAVGRVDQGLLQVTVVWPKLKGNIKPIAAAGQVIAHFPKGLVLSEGATRVKISGDAWHGAPVPDDTETLIAVTIPWRAA
ncbi:hypothetical protein ASG17_07580 [Brevundimonas sp. Leaf363]|uniref:phage tail terminator-like protein n=1 Tax=Brevundimonas sp. Leaf363 TaxID=1736353 RepID=UPI0006FAE1D0|nr:phage tail terminator-like protein [Brevundimonas sp. Leaf363]KQS55902.1 hypothetical protein ASG17_07580 [Brevundimonas sp. Leaf363]